MILLLPHLGLTVLAMTVQPTIQDLYHAAAKDAVYKAPTPAETATFAEIFLETLQGGHRDEVAGLRRSTIDGWVTLTDDAPTGRGFFALRPEGRPLFLQAPHAWGDDLDTGSIALRLARALEPQAVAWSTVSRTQVDLARAKESYLLSSTKAFDRTVEGALVLQIHGFSRSKRTTEKGRGVDVILSSGHRRTTERTRNIASCLKHQLGLKVGLFPELPELGALKNRQGQALPEGTFVHLELSRELRRSLTESPEQMAGVASCVEESLQ